MGVLRCVGGVSSRSDAVSEDDEQDDWGVQELSVTLSVSKSEGQCADPCEDIGNAASSSTGAGEKRQRSNVFRDVVRDRRRTLDTLVGEHGAEDSKAASSLDRLRVADSRVSEEDGVENSILSDCVLANLLDGVQGVVSAVVKGEIMREGESVRIGISKVDIRERRGLQRAQTRKLARRGLEVALPAAPQLGQSGPI